MAKLKIGDLFEIREGSDLCYGQYVGDKEHVGQLVRIFSKLYQQRPTADEVLAVSNWWLCFIFVDGDIKMGTALKFGHGPVPKNCCKTDFKDGIRNLFTGRIKNWETWNGKTRGTKRVAMLTEAQRVLPLREYVNVRDIMLRVRVGWTPASECDPDGPVGVFLYPNANLPKTIDKSESSIADEHTNKPGVELCNNDAAGDFFAEIAEVGLRCVTAALEGLESSKDLSRKGGLERDDASLVLAILALFIEARGGKVMEARQCGVEEAVARLAKPPTAVQAQRAIALAEKIREESELADLWDEQGQLAAWRKKVSALMARCQKMYESE